MIEDRKTHYSDMKHCERIGGNVLVEQMKVLEIMIVQCKYLNLDSCDLDIDNPVTCPLKLEKIVNVIER